jgi:hypothetical protein
VSHGSGEFERRLELVTSERCPPQAALDAESAALRGAWLALGELIEGTQGEPPRAAPASPLRPARRGKRRLPVVAAALAGSLLIAVSIAWCLWPAGVRGRSPLIPAPSTPLAVRQSEPSPAAPTSQVQPSRAPLRETDLAWEDPLDREIGVAARATVQVARNELALASGTQPRGHTPQDLSTGVQPVSF